MSTPRLLTRLQVSRFSTFYPLFQKFNATDLNVEGSNSRAVEKRRATSSRHVTRAQRLDDDDPWFDDDRESAAVAASRRHDQAASSCYAIDNPTFQHARNAHNQTHAGIHSSLAVDMVSARSATHARSHAPQVRPPVRRRERGRRP